MTDNRSEALRCLLCKKPKCAIQGCPVHTPVPECMALYREGKLDEAGKMLFENNPFSAITSLVCDWKQFCFGHCVLNVKQAPVHWYSVEQEISGKYLRKAVLERHSSELDGKRIAIVGAGPAGISAAVWLYEKGACVVLYDANPRLGGVLRYGIPAFRLEKSLVDEFDRILNVPGIELMLGTPVESVRALSMEYDKVIVCAGAEKPATLRIPGEEVALQALDFLKEPSKYNLGNKVIVIGGGNVAMDACRTAVRQGVETWVYYRKTFENMPANPLEVDEAREDGVQFAVFEAPVEVRPGGVVFRKCENVVPEDGGRVVTRIIDGTDHFVECDTLITAISEKPEFKLLDGAVFGEDGWPLVSENGLVEGFDNVYVAGDFRLGPRTVVEAVASARIVVDSL
ncbi:MAG: FAD-dependent oxidoreductase [Bacteroidales bacterium]|nr:FAD-dependent oxidoreductase [Bacteroidales bacterium]